MKKILILLLLVMSSSAFADFFVMGEPRTMSSSAEGACASWGGIKKLDHKLSSSPSGASDMPNFSCRVFGVIGGYPVSNVATVVFQGCSSGTSINGDKNACVPDSKCKAGIKVPMTDLELPVAAIKCANEQYNYEGCLVIGDLNWDSSQEGSAGPSCMDGDNFCTGHFIMTGQETSCSAPNEEDDKEEEKPEEEHKCPSGFIWTGTTCTADNSGNENGGEDNGSDGKEEGNDNNNNGSGGGNNSGGSSGGSGGGGGGGTGSPGTETGGGNGNGDGDGSSGGGGGSGSGSGNGNGDGEGEGSGKPYGKEFEKGDAKGFGDGLDEWDKKIEDSKKEIEKTIDDLYDTIKDDLVIRLPEGWGSLPCYKFSIPFYGTSMKICIADYESDLSYIRYALIFIASVFAAYVILR